MRVASPALPHDRSALKVVRRRPLPSAGAAQRLLRLFLLMGPDGQDALLDVAEQMIIKRPAAISGAPKLHVVRTRPTLSEPLLKPPDALDRPGAAITR